MNFKQEAGVRSRYLAVKTRSGRKPGVLLRVDIAQLFVCVEGVIRTAVRCSTSIMCLEKPDVG